MALPRGSDGHNAGSWETLADALCLNRKHEICRMSFKTAFTQTAKLDNGDGVSPVDVAVYPWATTFSEDLPRITWVELHDAANRVE
jgi:hypothetical protein